MQYSGAAIRAKRIGSDIRQQAPPKKRRKTATEAVTHTAQAPPKKPRKTATEAVTHTAILGTDPRQNSAVQPSGHHTRQVRSTLPVGFCHEVSEQEEQTQTSNGPETAVAAARQTDIQEIRPCVPLVPNVGEVVYDGKLTMTCEGRKWAITMSNTVSVASTQARIPLNLFAQTKRYKYNAKHVSAVNVPHNVPKCINMAYGPGKVICLGAEYNEVPEFAIHAQIYHMRKDLGIDLVPIYLRLENITCVIKPVLDDGAVYPIEINLKKFAKHPDYISRVRYPKNFQAALFRMDTRSFGIHNLLPGMCANPGVLQESGQIDNDVSVNIFPNGNCNMLGTRSKEVMLSRARYTIQVVTRVSKEQRLEREGVAT